MMNEKTRTALVIGGCRGIGREITLRLAKDGFDVLPTCRKCSDETEKLAEETRDLVRTEYNIGRVTATRLNEAQTDLTNAQAARAKAIILYWQYRENLAATTGKIMEPAK